VRPRSSEQEFRGLSFFVSSQQFAFRTVLLVAAALPLVGRFTCADEQTVDRAPNTGAIEGTVSYQADPNRPWRYARYYVKQLKTGELAEAVVALRAKATSDAVRQPQTIVVDQQNFQFLPETVAIRRGDSVKFTNADQATHNVQSSSDFISFNANMAGGGEHTVRFERAGGISQPAKVGCVFHSAMRAWIFAFDHPWFQVTPTSGKFRLSDVPAGQYELEMVHPAGELRWRKRVEVKAGETLRIDIRVSPDDKM
jgi:plastocyanin